MGKTYEEEQYERGVRDGQKEDYFNDEWNMLRFFEPKEYDKGYEYGKKHRYNENGERYHNLNGTGINDKKDDTQKEDSSSSSICYLTTACIKSMNLPDNCLELRILRNFRDKILMEDYTGRKVVKEYYKIAPLIVESINKREDSQSIWKSVYNNIRKAVSLVKSRNFNSAFEHYKEMALNLKERHLS